VGGAARRSAAEPQAPQILSNQYSNNYIQWAQCGPCVSCSTKRAIQLTARRTPGGRGADIKTLYFKWTTSDISFAISSTVKLDVLRANLSASDGL
jgi:hypothetical protein